ncbi:TetR/AcrR family transcriptional regulator [Pollutimonas thiosulfatoxidans]|uniref:TetR family transcriptional regulator n=1 Tax=Pollutimonas thiosulfatoxidans TaxID=2028345 RepID=A0A410GAL3_9BURK|nr:TetR/AcrR family transcriptional regulator [Pollutimonas thiosulfatoxidans]MBF6617316.1 TetR family transcriptional regulator [Candidimonas sp.]QAA93265.1 TetR family transcriptional regulator [Pollutimonas thiosulfatoxidans]
MNHLATRPPVQGEEDRRTVVILTAARLFRENGYERTTVRELAEAVGLRSGSLFHHFKSKEEILVAVMANGIQSVIDEGRQLVQQHADPAGRLEGLFRLHMHSIISGVGGDAMHAMIYDWRSLSREAREPIEQLSKAYEQLWHEAIDLAVASGLLQGDAAIIRKHLLGGMNATVRWYRPDGRLGAEAFIDQMLQAALPAMGSWHQKR